MCTNRHDYDFSKYEEIVVKYVATGTIASGFEFVS